MRIGARALVRIAACGRVRVRICFRSAGARLLPEPWRSLVPEPWRTLLHMDESVSGFASVAPLAHCPSGCYHFSCRHAISSVDVSTLEMGTSSLVLEPWCPRVPVVECVSGFASVAQVPAWCPSPGHWCPLVPEPWCLLVPKYMFGVDAGIIFNKIRVF